MAGTKVHELLKLYSEVEVPPEHLLFKIPSTWQVSKAYKYGHKSKLMAAAIRNKQDILSLIWVDHIIAPLKILDSLKESVTPPDTKYSFMRRLSLSSAMAYDFSKEELVNWDRLTFASAMGPAAEELLGAGLEGYMNQTKRVEELCMWEHGPATIQADQDLSGLGRIQALSFY
ncbi:uncharacterized protein [Aristolochia californica]|uniref:uncharacterized protein n=1 Tax=Aristolochia californica TaxID=171875 RepID=UPI0035E010B9